jgi:hypothetical protein
MKEINENGEKIIAVDLKNVSQNLKNTTVYCLKKILKKRKMRVNHTRLFEKLCNTLAKTANVFFRRVDHGASCDAVKHK